MRSGLDGKNRRWKLLKKDTKGLPTICGQASSIVEEEQGEAADRRP